MNKQNLLELSQSENKNTLADKNSWSREQLLFNLKITPTQLETLQAIDKLVNASQREWVRIDLDRLSREMGISYSACRERVRWIVKHGFVKRKTFGKEASQSYSLYSLCDTLRVVPKCLNGLTYSSETVRGKIEPLPSPEDFIEIAEEFGYSVPKGKERAIINNAYYLITTLKMTYEGIRNYFTKVVKCYFLMGTNLFKFKPDLYWLSSLDRAKKVLSGMYRLYKRRSKPGDDKKDCSNKSIKTQFADMVVNGGNTPENRIRINEWLIGIGKLEYFENIFNIRNIASVFNLKESDFKKRLWLKT